MSNEVGAKIGDQSAADQPLIPSEEVLRSFPCLDGVRAFAASTVIAYHLTTVLLVIAPGAVPSVVVRHIATLDRFGVAIFFMLSGFLLYRPFVIAQLKGESAPRVVAFWVRRGARIFPGYWFALIGSMLLGVAVFNQPDLTSYAVGFGLLGSYHAYGVLSYGLVVAWTLVIEIAFYALLPAFAAIARSISGRSSRSAVLRSNLVVVSALVLIGMLSRYISIFVVSDWGGPQTTWFPLYNLGSWLPSYLDMFGLGMLLALASAWRETGGANIRALRIFAERPWASWGIAAIMVIALGRAGMPRVPGLLYLERSSAFIRDELSIIAAFAIILPAAIPGVRLGSLRRILASRPFYLCGTVAFGAYLWHLSLVILIERWSEDFEALKSAPIFVAMALLLTGLAAYVSYVLVEAPFRSLATIATGGRRQPSKRLRDWAVIDSRAHASRIEGFVIPRTESKQSDVIIVLCVTICAAMFALYLPSLRGAL